MTALTAVLSLVITATGSPIAAQSREHCIVSRLHGGPRAQHGTADGDRLKADLEEMDTAGSGFISLNEYIAYERRKFEEQEKLRWQRTEVRIRLR